MRKTMLCAAALLLSLDQSAAAFAGQAHPAMKAYTGQSLLLYLKDNVAVPFTVNANGTISFVDIHIGEEGIKDSYVQTLPYEVRENKAFCVLKPANEQECWDLVELKVNEPRAITVTSYEQGRAVWSGTGELMLLSQK